MNFINPLMLIGLAAAGIPVLLHLLNLRKLKTVEFSSLQFLKELQKTKIKKLKLKQIILLVLRTLIIIFAVLAFARPAIKGTIPGFESYTKSSCVILVDNSFSMDMSDEYGNRLNQTKKAIKSILANMKDGDEAVVIEMANMGSPKSYSFTRNPQLIEDKLNHIKPANAAANLDRALNIASIMLEDANNFNKEIYVISDFQKNTLDDKESIKLKEKNIAVYLAPIGYNSQSDPVNLSVDSLTVLTGIFQAGKPVEIAAIIRNNSGTEVKGAVVSMLFNGERVAQRSVDIPGGESRTVAIAAQAPASGIIRATVELENDALETDNKRHFGFVIPDKPNVAIIGEANKSIFLALALGGESGAFVKLKRFNTADCASINLDDFDVVILSGGNYRQGDMTRLANYVGNGGSTLIFANELADRNVFVQSVQQFGFGAVSEKSFPDNQKGVFLNTDKIHPLFQGVFNQNTDGKSNMESPQITKAFPVNSGYSIIDMSGGAFLSEVKYGSGRAIYCAVSPDASESNFPLTSIFPAFVYRSAYYLSATEDLAANFEINSRSSLSLPKKLVSDDNMKIVDPKNNEFFKRAAMIPTGAIISLEDFGTPGVYSIYNSKGKLVSLVSLNLPKNESYINKPIEKELTAEVAKRFEKDVPINFIADPAKIIDGIFRARSGTELWQFMLLFAIICAVAEMIVAKVSKNDMGEG